MHEVAALAAVESACVCLGRQQKLAAVELRCPLSPDRQQGLYLADEGFDLLGVAAAGPVE